MRVLEEKHYDNILIAVAVSRSIVNIIRLDDDTEVWLLFGNISSSTDENMRQIYGFCIGFIRSISNASIARDK